MNERPPLLVERQEEDSQLGQLRRIQLYARKPWDIFAIVSGRERRLDAVWIFALYFVVKTPVLIQRAAARGQIERFGVGTSAIVFGLALLVAIVLSLVLFVLVGALLHLLLNRVWHTGRTLGDAIRLPILSLAPQLLLVVEFPTLFLDFGAESTFVTFTVLRVVVDALSFRAFYWGLRRLFGVSARRALLVVLVLAAPIGLLALAMLRSAPR